MKLQLMRCDIVNLLLCMGILYSAYIVFEFSANFAWFQWTQTSSHAFTVQLRYVHCSITSHSELSQTWSGTILLLLLLLLLLFWQAPPGVHGTKRRHQSPEWTILSHVNCFIQGEVTGLQVLIYVVRGGPGGLLQFSKEKLIINTLKHSIDLHSTSLSSVNVTVQCTSHSTQSSIVHHRWPWPSFLVTYTLPQWCVWNKRSATAHHRSHHSAVSSFCHSRVLPI